MEEILEMKNCAQRIDVSRIAENRVSKVFIQNIINVSKEGY